MEGGERSRTVVVELLCDGISDHGDHIDSASDVGEEAWIGTRAQANVP